jgi:hypothetical protein
MNPILGIIASSISGSLNASSYESIQTVTLGSAQSTISFSSIPSTYKHLQIRGIMKTSATSGGSTSITFNSDTAGNYSMHGLSGNGASASAYGFTGETKIYVGYGTQDTTQFSALIIDILEYANTNTYKTVRALSGLDTNGGGIVELLSGNWRSTSAVTSITLTPQSANFTQYSSFALYGVKG